jgi:hypothetical protein
LVHEGDKQRQGKHERKRQWEKRWKEIKRWENAGKRDYFNFKEREGRWKTENTEKKVIQIRRFGK